MDSKFVTSQRLPAGSTVQGTIAAALTNLADDSERYYKSWETVWPTKEDFEQSMPICWSEELQALLPVATKGIYLGQDAENGLLETKLNGHSTS
jgi:hypothetical protein